nr:MAG TPA: Major capsid protein [Caudoviricetes sp.]
MKDVLKYPLHIQYFADDGAAQPNTGDGNDNNGASPSAQGANSSVSIDYDKIADVLDKRGSQAQYAALKGYLKEQGVSADEMDKAIKEFKDKKEADKQSKEKEQADMLAENQRLKLQIQNIEIDKKISELAEGVSAEKLPFLAKLIDRSKLLNDKGEINEDSVKAAIEEVVKAFPDFKAQAGTTTQGFTKIGADGSNSKASLDDVLAKNFGVKK